MSVEWEVDASVGVDEGDMRRRLTSELVSVKQELERRKEARRAAAAAAAAASAAADADGNDENVNSATPRREDADRVRALEEQLASERAAAFKEKERLVAEKREAAAQVKEADAKVKAVQDECSKLREALVSARNELSEYKESVEQEDKTTYNENLELRGIAEQLSEQLEELKAKEESFKRQQAQHDELKRKVHDSDVTIRDLRSQITGLETQHTKELQTLRSNAEAQRKEFQKQKDEWLMAKEASEADASQLSVTLRELHEVEAAKDELMDKNAALEGEAARLKQQVAMLCDKLDEQEAVVERAEKTREDAERMAASERKKAENAKAEMELVRASVKQQRTDAMKERVRQRMASRQEQKALGATALQQLEVKIAVLQGQLNDERKKNESMLEHQEDIEDELENKEIEVTELQARVLEWQARSIDSEQKLEAAQTELAKVRAAYEELEKNQPAEKKTDSSASSAVTPLKWEVVPDVSTKRGSENRFGFDPRKSYSDVDAPPNSYNPSTRASVLDALRPVGVASNSRGRSTSFVPVPELRTVDEDDDEDDEDDGVYYVDPEEMDDETLAQYEPYDAEGDDDDDDDDGDGTLDKETAYAVAAAAVVATQAGLQSIGDATGSVSEKRVSKRAPVMPVSDEILDHIAMPTISSTQKMVKKKVKRRGGVSSKAGKGKSVPSYMRATKSSTRNKKAKRGSNTSGLASAKSRKSKKPTVPKLLKAFLSTPRGVTMAVPLKKTKKRHIYSFGTRRVHLVVIGGSLMVRIGGGFVSIEEFVDEYALIEARKVERSSASRNGSAISTASAASVSRKSGGRISSSSSSSSGRTPPRRKKKSKAGSSLSAPDRPSKRRLSMKQLYNTEEVVYFDDDEEEDDDDEDMTF